MPTAPTVSTLAATVVTSQSATLNGSVNPNGLATTMYFQWGTSIAYGSTTVSQSVGSGTAGLSANANLSNVLSPNTTYHFRLVASNSAGPAYGADQAFTTTSSGSVPPSVTTAAASNLSASSATLNGTVNPNGLTTTAHFEWGTSTSYGQITSDQFIGSGTSTVGVNANLATGLAPNTTYHFRLVASTRNHKF